MSLTNFLMPRKPWVVDVSAECIVSPLRVEGLPSLDTSPRKISLRDDVVVWARNIREARAAVAEGIRSTYTSAIIHFNNTHPYEGTNHFHQSQYFPSLNTTL